MICPNCKAPNLIVLESRSTLNDTGIRRRRKCENCNHLLTTTIFRKDSSARKAGSTSSRPRQGKGAKPQSIRQKLFDPQGLLLKYINDTPELASLLYDLDMLPEQLEKGSHDWNRMMMLTIWHGSSRNTRGI